MTFTSPSYRFFLVLSLALFTGLAFFAIAEKKVLAITALEMVVSECKKRTGFSDATCTTLIKKYMNVDRCKEYTGWDDEECKKKIEEIKNDPEFYGDGSGGGGQVPSPTTPTVTPGTGSATAFLETARRVRAKKESDLLLLWKRTENITNYFKEKGADTSGIETQFPEFERKAEAVLAAYDTYLEMAERAPKDETLRERMLGDARLSVERSLYDLTGFYRSNILGPLISLANQKL